MGLKTHESKTLCAFSRLYSCSVCSGHSGLGAAALKYYIILGDPDIMVSVILKAHPNFYVKSYSVNY